MTVYDLHARKVITDITDIAAVHGVLAIPDLHQVYASATGDNQVVVIDANSEQIVKRIPVGQYPDGLAFDPADKKLFVSDETGQTVSVVDINTDQFVEDISLGGEVGNSQYDPIDKRIYSAVQTRNQLVAIDPQQDRVIDRYDLPGCEGLHGFAVDEDTHYALVTCEDNAKLVVFDLTAKKVIASDSVGETPDVVAVDRGLHRLYVAAESGTFTIFDIGQRRVAKVAQGFLADRAHSVSVDEATHRMYIPLENVNGQPVLRILEPTS